MCTINERIKRIRNLENLSQLEFSKKLGATQSSISMMERNGRNVSEITIKSICSHFGINENWLRYGKGTMYQNSSSFNLEQFLHEQEATDLELEIVKAYFELDKDIRKTVLEHFQKHFLKSKNSETDMAALFPDTAKEFETQFKIESKKSDLG